MKYLYVILTLFVILISCKTIQYKESFVLDGKHIWLEYKGDTLLYFNNGVLKKIRLSNCNDYGCYDNPRLLHKNDCILVIAKTQLDSLERIVKIDTTGKIIDTLYTSLKGHYIDDFSISLNDSLVFIREFDDNELRKDKSPDNVWPEFKCFHYLVNVDSKNIIDSFVISSRIYLYGSKEPNWDLNSQKVLFIKSLAQTSNNRKSDIAYYYDLKKKTSIFIDSCNNISWIPNDSGAVCIKQDNEIIKFNLLTKNKTILYKASRRESIDDCRFSPNGKYLLVQCHTHYFFLRLFGERISWHPYDKLISLDNKEKYLDSGKMLIDSWKE